MSFSDKIEGQWDSLVKTQRTEAIEALQSWVKASRENLINPSDKTQHALTIASIKLDTISSLLSGSLSCVKRIEEIMKRGEKELPKKELPKNEYIATLNVELGVLKEILALKQERLEQHRFNEQQRKKELIEKKRLEKERLEKERFENERLKGERLEKERLEKLAVLKKRLANMKAAAEEEEKQELLAQISAVVPFDEIQVAGVQIYSF